MQLNAAHLGAPPRNLPLGRSRQASW